ncbi:MAG TPA: FoF1 ATP synthase subunit gamma, partial [Candidatus Omnitrophota bacterium]|nr:FoF1 ATP synthase subunit gamma [Candidatus Omnitrophota bacterium]
LSYTLAKASCADNPFVAAAQFAGRPQGAAPTGRKIALCVISSDTGLCGTYNNNLFRKAEEFIKENSGSKVSLAVIGRKGFNYFRRKGYELPLAYHEPRGNYTGAMLEKILSDLNHMFLSARVSRIYLAYTRFESSSRQKPVIEEFLPLSLPVGDAQCASPTEEYLIEPDAQTVLNELVPVYIANKMRTAILEAKTSEHASRVISMAKATDNAKELLEDLILLRNKVRQSGITKEILEIISSAEALK